MIKYKRNAKGKIQIIPKKNMLKRYGKSPDRPDSASYCFYNMTSIVKKKLIRPPRRIINPTTGERINRNVDFDEENNAFISSKEYELW
jgi:hypothetical protein